MGRAADNEQFGQIKNRQMQMSAKSSTRLIYLDWPRIRRLLRRGTKKEKLKQCSKNGHVKTGLFRVEKIRAELRKNALNPGGGGSFLRQIILQCKFVIFVLFLVGCMRTQNKRGTLFQDLRLQPLCCLFVVWGGLRGRGLLQG